MGSNELIANLFRISQTEQKLKIDNIQGEDNANKTHYKMGKDIRKFIKDQGGIMPENLPTPTKSLKQIEKEIEKVNDSVESMIYEIRGVQVMLSSGVVKPYQVETRRINKETEFYNLKSQFAISSENNHDGVRCLPYVLAE